jgi:hypothetical protein
MQFDPESPAAGTSMSSAVRRFVSLARSKEDTTTTLYSLPPRQSRGRTLVAAVVPCFVPGKRHTAELEQAPGAKITRRLWVAFNAYLRGAHELTQDRACQFHTALPRAVMRPGHPDPGSGPAPI